MIAVTFYPTVAGEGTVWISFMPAKSILQKVAIKHFCFIKFPFTGISMDEPVGNNYLIKKIPIMLIGKGANPLFI